VWHEPAPAEEAHDGEEQMDEGEAAQENPENNQMQQEEAPKLMLDVSDDEELQLHDDVVVRHMRGEPSTMLKEPDPCPEIDEATKQSVRQAHKNLAHPALDTFERMLRLGGAKDNAITYAKHWQCPVLGR
jgi:hypothetical protein